MEESLFRQLLSHRANSLLDQATLAKGADYLRHGRVREIRYEADDESGTLFGAIQGREPTPYSAAILIDLNGGKPRIDTRCTCPLQGECKHVAAIALKMLGGRQAAESNPPQVADARSQASAWKPWFESLETRSGSVQRTANVDPGVVFGILLRVGEGALPGLLAQPVWLKPLKRGGLGSPQPVGHFQYGIDPWQRLTPRQFEHVARLRMASPHFASSAWYPLNGERDEALLEILLEEYPCFVDKPSKGRTTLGEHRELTWGWRVSEEGNQKLVPQLAEGNGRTRLLRIAQIWYHDPATQTLGRVDGDARLIDAAMRAPPLRPEESEFVVEHWRNHSHLQGLPKPARAEAPQVHRVTPTPVLTLRAFPVLTYAQGMANRYQAGSVRLSFDYEGPRLPFAPAKPRERRLHEGRLLEVVRDRSAEISACEQLEALGLIDTPIAEHAITDLGDLMRVSDKLLAVLTAEYRSEPDMMAAFTRPAGDTALQLEDYPHVEADARYLVALLKSAVGADAERGVNILLYGPPGTGKTEFAKLMARLAQCELYEVDCLDREGNSLSGKERYRSLQVSQAFLGGRGGTALLFDEVEDVFPPISEKSTHGFGIEDARPGAVNGKAWVNRTLEQNPVPTIWISNSINQIDPAYRRRFQFHLELANPPQRVRENIARKHLADLAVSEAFIARIAARKQVTPAQIQSAARFARLTSRALGEATEALIERQLDRSDKALGHLTDPEYRVSPTRYDLDLLNVESRFPIPRIIAALGARPRATLCFYGLPGTGKTALAEHIAKSLEKPLMIKRASDLVSKYVGETEQQMAKMFGDAGREGAVLLLDEADSFLQNRQLAVRNYEVTEVNEMLQGMERFEGIFICTTNLFDRIDEAALRRFSFKLRFLPLTQPNRERMFVAEVLGGDASRLTDEVRAALARLELLTPGDFAAVVRQYQLLADEASPAEFLEQLEREHRAKPDVRFSKPLGFLH